MPTYIKSVSFYNRAALVGEFNSRKDDAVLNRVLDNLRGQGANVNEISVTSSGGFFKYVLTYVIAYEAEAPSHRADKLDNSHATRFRNRPQRMTIHLHP